MLISDTIPSLVHGVSQQSDSLRLPTQAQEQVNFHSSVVGGLSDRPPTQHIKKINTTELANCLPHIINRDRSERYVVLFKNGDLTVHDLDGNEKIVNFPNGKSYLQANTPNTTIRATTVSDYTFVLNTEKLTALSSTVSTTRAAEGLVFVKQGGYGVTYSVFVDGVSKASYTTSTTDVLTLRTNLIADNLRSQLVTNLSGTHSVSANGSVIYVVKVGGGNFNLRCADSVGDTNMIGFKDVTTHYTELPDDAPNGFEIKVTNSDGVQDDFYVKRVVTGTGGGSTWGPGIWQETLAQNIQYKFDANTMPHVLVRTANGTFDFKQSTWDDLSVGDTNTAPTPSFIGKAISDLVFFKNRLGLFAGDSQVYSGVGEYFNFWRTTVITELDSDPIDYVVSHNKVPKLKNVVVFSEKLLLFSEQTQFITQGLPVFTKRTITTDPTTEFDSVPVCKPVAIGKFAYFVFNRGSYDGLREYFIDQDSQVKNAAEITGHVPKYIPSGTYKLIPSSTEDMLIALTTSDPASMYVYKFYYQNDQKIQSAWSKVVLGDSTTTRILGGEFVGSTLYLVIQRPFGVFLEQMNYAPGVVDPGVNYVTHYDRRLTEASCNVAYNSGNDDTTWTLPYTIDANSGNTVVVTREVNPGHQLTTTVSSGTTVTVPGNYANTKVYIGQTYERKYVFSKFYMRKQHSDGQSSIVTAGRLQLRTGTITYSDTGTFTVTVTQDYRNPSAYTAYRDPFDSTFTDIVYTGQTLGGGQTLLGAVALADGEYHFPIMAENQKVTITVTTDSFLPCHLSSCTWEGAFHSRSRIR